MLLVSPVAERRSAKPLAALPALLPVSIIILGSRPQHLKACLTSIAEALSPAPAEIIVVCNGTLMFSDAEVAALKLRLPGLSFIEILKSSLGRARNAAVRAAKFSTLAFLDDDVTVPRHYFQTLAEKLAAYPQVAAIGGPNRTPPLASLFQACVGLVLSSRFGAGPLRYRCIGYAGDRATDDRGLILCNLVLRRPALTNRHHPFPEDMERNEENVLLDELQLGGAKFMHCPDLFVRHARRTNLKSFARQCYQSGVGRGQMTRRRFASLKGYFLAPLLPLATLALLPLAPYTAAAALTLYALTTITCAATLGKRFPSSEGRAFSHLCTLFPTGHLSYAVGLLVGLTRR
jgi:hypothetical protein